MSILGFDRHDGRQVISFFWLHVRERYMGSAFGSVWAVANPLLMLVMFTFVFGFVFKVRLPDADSTLTYAVWMICGYGPWLGISDSLQLATTSVVNSNTLVKNLVFKTELLPLAAVMLGFIPLLVTLGFLLLLLPFSDYVFGWSALGVLPLLGLLYVFLSGLGMLLAALNVFLRDVALVLPNVLMLGLFGTPIFYAPAAIPERLRWLVEINPFYHFTDLFRGLMLRHEWPGLGRVLYLVLISLLLFYVGLVGFRRVKGLFDSRL